MYCEITRSIKITVEPSFLDDHSEPDEFHFVWAYEVKIENLGGETVQLLHRHWKITDSNGQTQEVRGDGVVGEQPILAPGEIFEYTSGAPLNTPSGIMRGSYGMINEAGLQFDIPVPAFSLDSPHEIVHLH
ncbi:MAG: Co2+/Mg2+ efflux protein ApaG [Alphaproteobacteria bacterium]|jgi:ApaG protein|nr:Co2+/Mg2+ efflux protein ApaG [Alphaproteobacteria bacterium]